MQQQNTDGKNKNLSFNQVDKTDLDAVIAYNKAYYEQETKEEILGHLSYTISRLYYRKANQIKGEDEAANISRDHYYKSNAHWMGKAYQHGKPAAHYLFYVALEHEGEEGKDSFRYQVDVAEKLGIPLNDDGKTDLLSYGLTHGENGTCWSLSQAIHFRNDNVKKAQTNVFEKHGIPFNDLSGNSLLITSSLGNHMKASQTLYYKIEDRTITQPTIDRLFEHIEQNVALDSINTKALSMAIKNQSFKDHLLNTYTENTLDIFKENARKAQKYTEFLRAKLIETYQI